MRTLDDLDPDGKRVLVRVDFNVPLDERQRITDDVRVRAALPTLVELRSRGARQLILAAHLGRPNDPELAERYAALADLYVNDAFGAAHRAHASTEAVAHLLPSAAGRLMEREVRTLTGILENPKRPLVAVMGGAKVTDKI